MNALATKKGPSHLRSCKEWFMQGRLLEEAPLAQWRHINHLTFLISALDRPEHPVGQEPVTVVEEELLKRATTNETQDGCIPYLVAVVVMISGRRSLKVCSGSSGKGQATSLQCVAEKDQAAPMYKNNIKKNNPCVQVIVALSVNLAQIQTKVSELLRAQIGHLSWKVCRDGIEPAPPTVLVNGNLLGKG